MESSGLLVAYISTPFGGLKGGPVILFFVTFTLGLVLYKACFNPTTRRARIIKLRAGNLVRHN